jgi:hypothetical protein
VTGTTALAAVRAQLSDLTSKFTQLEQDRRTEQDALKRAHRCCKASEQYRVEERATAAADLKRAKEKGRAALIEMRDMLEESYAQIDRLKAQLRAAGGPLMAMVVSADDAGDAVPRAAAAAAFDDHESAMADTARRRVAHWREEMAREDAPGAYAPPQHVAASAQPSPSMRPVPTPMAAVSNYGVPVALTQSPSRIGGAPMSRQPSPAARPLAAVAALGGSHSRGPSGAMPPRASPPPLMPAHHHAHTAPLPQPDGPRDSHVLTARRANLGSLLRAETEMAKAAAQRREREGSQPAASRY